MATGRWAIKVASIGFIGERTQVEAIGFEVKLLEEASEVRASDGVRPMSLWTVFKACDHGGRGLRFGALWGNLGLSGDYLGFSGSRNAVIN